MIGGWKKLNYYFQKIVQWRLTVLLMLIENICKQNFIEFRNGRVENCSFLWWFGISLYIVICHWNVYINVPTINI